MPRKLRMFCKIQDVKRAKNAYLMFSTANSSKAIEKKSFCRSSDLPGPGAFPSPQRQWLKCA